MTSLTFEHSLALSEDAQHLLFRDARSANSFTDVPVSTETIDAIYDLTKFGPTAMNNQPLRLLLVQSDDARARLLPHMAEGNRAKTATAPLVAVLAADTDFHDHLPKHFPQFPEARDMFVGKDEMRTDQATFNAALQIGYFIVGVRAAGLAAGPMAGFDKAGIDAEFFSDSAWKSQLVVNIGHPAEDAWLDRLPRLAVRDAVSVA
jgi:3-hydroxypropanoate dehydrogenase